MNMADLSKRSADTGCGRRVAGRAWKRLVGLLSGAAATAALIDMVGTDLMGEGGTVIGIRGRYLAERKREVEVKCATFGSSHTWGAGLEDRHDAYPYLLSPKVRNLAIRAHTNLYPSMCLSSMLGDEVFDVFVIEANMGIDDLARRLRQRFPDAVIIFLGHIYPLQIRYHSKSGGDINLKQWADKYAPGIDKGDPAFVDRMEKDEDGTFWLNIHPYQRTEFIQGLSNLVDGHPAFPYEGVGPEEYIKRFANRTFAEYHHPTAEGHKAYAKIIGGIVDEQMKDYPVHPRVQEWQIKDNCQNWFESGKMDFPVKDMKMNEFSPTKHALEVGKSGGSLIVSNPTDKPMYLALEVMMTSGESKLYPRTRVSILGNEDNAVTIDPLVDIENRSVHVAFPRKIGIIPPGKSSVEFLPLEKSKEPFRVVAFFITPTELMAEHW